MLPRLGSSKLVNTWLWITIVASALAAIAGGLAGWLTLAPDRIWRGELWRLVTWAVIEVGPMQLVMTCVAIYYFGSQLAAIWGDRRLRRFMLEIVLGAAAATTLLALVSDDARYMHHTGGLVVDDVLVIAWARQFPTRVLKLYGVLELRGPQLIALTVGVTVIYALFTSPFVMAPELAACAGAALYPSRWLRR